MPANRHHENLKRTPHYDLRSLVKSPDHLSQSAQGKFKKALLNLNYRTEQLILRQ
jgi:phage terminase small subunit